MFGWNNEIKENEPKRKSNLRWSQKLGPFKRGFGFLGDICVNSKSNWKSPTRINLFFH